MYFLYYCRKHDFRSEFNGYLSDTNRLKYSFTKKINKLQISYNELSRLKIKTNNFINLDTLELSNVPINSSITNIKVSKMILQSVLGSNHEKSQKKEISITRHI